MADKKATLVLEWSDGKQRYRLISKGKFSAGYEDEFFIDKLGVDTLGEPTWVKLLSWSAGSNELSDLMFGAIKFLLSDQAERERLRKSEAQ